MKLKRKTPDTPELPELPDFGTMSPPLMMSTQKPPKPSASASVVPQVQAETEVANASRSSVVASAPASDVSETDGKEQSSVESTSTGEPRSAPESVLVSEVAGASDEVAKSQDGNHITAEITSQICNCICCFPCHCMVSSILKTFL